MNNTNEERRVMNTILTHLASSLARGWWLLLLRGLVAIIFGVLAWVQPGITLAALVLLFGAYSMADGVLCLWTAITGPKGHEYWWLLLLQGLVGIGIGFLTFFAPGITALALLFYIAIWAIATGVLEIAAAIRLRKEIDNEWLLLVAGLASVAFGILLAAQPAAGALAVLWLIGSYAILFGVLLLILAFKIRKFVPKLS
ncbi:MAG TPA: HdeD family acid-resistance protein [Stellaceae bacterium]|nr:HdeD family acid-resistance protein [Stellaceae bacterium]